MLRTRVGWFTHNKRKLYFTSTFSVPSVGREPVCSLAAPPPRPPATIPQKAKCSKSDLSSPKIEFNPDGSVYRYVITDYRNARKALSHPKVGKSVTGLHQKSYGFSQAIKKENLGMSRVDGAAHWRLRIPVVKEMQKYDADSLKSAFSVIAKELIVAAEKHQKFDFVEGIALPYSHRILAFLLKIPQCDQQDLQRLITAWMHNLKTGTTEEERTLAADADRQLREYFVGLVEQRSQCLTNDFVSNLLKKNLDDKGLTAGEVAKICFEVSIALISTLSHLVENGWVALLQNPSELEKLRASPDLLPAAVEEMLRYAPPVLEIHRYVKNTMLLDGCQIQQGQTITIDLKRVNRDPRVYTCPDQFIIDRPRLRALSVTFGGGAHVCLGAKFAKSATAAFYLRSSSAPLSRSTLHLIWKLLLSGIRLSRAIRSWSC